jgi:hypothetical protein
VAAGQHPDLVELVEERCNIRGRDPDAVEPIKKVAASLTSKEVPADRSEPAMKRPFCGTISTSAARWGGYAQCSKGFILLLPS